MKTFFKVFLLLFFLFTNSFVSVFAQESGGKTGAPAIPQQEIIPPLPSPPNASLLYHTHYYTVLFRGNGEAIVYLKAIFPNLQASPLSQLQFHLPKISINDLAVFQIKRERQCVRYEPLSTPMPLGEKPIGTSPSLYPTSQCAQYQEPDYYSYWTGTTRYLKAETSTNDNVLTVFLPNPLETNQSGSILLSYRTFDYAHKNIFGAYEYVFETLKIDDKINTLQVGINTDSDFILSGTQGQINYQVNEAAKALSVPYAPDQIITNPQLDSFYNQIGYGAIVKTSSGLKPLESYTIKGSFADFSWKLYAKGVVKGLVIVLIVLVIIALIVRWLWLRMTHAMRKTEQIKLDRIAIFESFGISFVSSLLILLYTLLISFLTSYLNSWLGYYFINSSMFIFIFLATLSFCIYTFCLFAPPLFMLIKKGFLWGAVTFGLTICWLTVYLLIALVIVFFASPKGYPSYPVQPLGGRVESVEKPAPVSK